MKAKLKHRDSKFRAWINNEMIYLPMAGLNYFDFEGSYALSFVVDGYNAFYAHECYETIKPEFILMEYTGGKEKCFDGIEVWEEDIIENCDTKELQVVYWNEDKFAWYCYYLIDEKKIVSLYDSLGNLNKVIGNIYENPELLNNNEKL